MSVTERDHQLAAELVGVEPINHPELQRALAARVAEAVAAERERVIGIKVLLETSGECDCSYCIRDAATEVVLAHPHEPLIGRRYRVVPALSPFLRRRLVDLADSFLDEDLDEVAGGLSKLIQDASRGMCLHCGSYEKCPCDDQADQIATGGY